MKDVVDANIYALDNFEKLNGEYYEVGSGNARSFEDVLDILKIDFQYTDESVIPKGYQFYTCSDKTKWMSGWEPKWNLENGLNDYIQYLTK